MRFIRLHENGNEFDGGSSTHSETSQELSFSVSDFFPIDNLCAGGGKANKFQETIEWKIASIYIVETLKKAIQSSSKERVLSIKRLIDFVRFLNLFKTNSRQNKNSRDETAWKPKISFIPAIRVKLNTELKFQK